MLNTPNPIGLEGFICLECLWVKMPPAFRDDDSDQKTVVRCMVEHLRVVFTKARELLLPQYANTSKNT